MEPRSASHLIPFSSLRSCRVMTNIPEPWELHYDGPSLDDIEDDPDLFDAARLARVQALEMTA